MFSQYIATHSLMDLFKAKESNQGARAGMWLWEQGGIGLTGARDMATAAVDADEDGMVE